MRSSSKKSESFQLSTDQWSFLSVIHAFEEPVSIDMVGKLVPLPPGPLIDLLKKIESNNWFIRTEDDTLSFADNLPQEVLKKFYKVNTPQHMRHLIERIKNEKLTTLIAPGILTRIMHKAEMFLEAGQLEITLSEKALKKQDIGQRRFHLGLAVSALSNVYKNPDASELFISATLAWSNASFALGKNPLKVEPSLQKAQKAAEISGNIRSQSLLNFHLGRVYYFTDRRDEALIALSLGKEEIEELQDSDIQEQSAIFMGLYYFILGEHTEAFTYLEKAIQMNENTRNPPLIDPMGPVYFGYCAAFLGRFHRAIGHLDYYIRLSHERHDVAISSTLRAMLGTFLAQLQKYKEAEIHLQRAEKEAKQTGNAFGMYLKGGGVAMIKLLKGEKKAAYDLMTNVFKTGRESGFIQQFASPWILEMLYDFHQSGYDPIPFFELPDIMKKVMEGVNIHLQGVCLRLKAKQIVGQSGSHPKVSSLLKESEKKLRISGDPVQTAKTLLEISRLELIKGHRDKAQAIAQEARHMLGGYVEEFFPDELKLLVEDKGIFFEKGLNEEKFLDKYLGMLESLRPSRDRIEILSRMFSSTSQIFAAERGGLFWFSNGKYTENPELRSSLNLPPIEIDSSNFRPSMNLILKTQKRNEPFSEELTLKELSLGKKFIRSVLAIPIEVKGQVHGVSYYDNSYFANAFDFLNLPLLKQMARLTNMVVEQNLDHIKEKHRADKLASEKQLLLDNRKGKIITQSTRFQQLLVQIGHVAKTESTILILGETGTGKELIAKHIHEESLRNQGSFVIVDSTTIPANLIESELFGHEKGAFTGADKSKIGCIEMADNGTLFLDEIGELPLSAQAKLLRTLQEKTIRRVGGISHIASDFRLIAATNRDLAAEVKQGRFREDLFYRLNVVPFKLPPLRKRGKDPILLSQYFIDRYTKKYNFKTIALSAEEKKDIMSYPWPGNIRELKNVMERAVLLSDGTKLGIDLQISPTDAEDDLISDLPTLNEIQRRYIRHVLDHTQGKVSGPGGACEILGLKRPSFYSKLRSLDYKKKQ